MVVNAIAENVFGTFGTICWSVQLIPQIIKSYRTKSTTGLSEWLILMWAMAGPVLGVYVIAQNLNIPLILQSQLFTLFTSTSWIQCQYYGNKRPLITCIIIFSTMLSVMAGFQIGMVYAVRAATNSGNLRPQQFFGVFTSILLSIGFIPQFYEIFKRKEVIGISMMFMFIDCLGGVSSTISLIFKPNIDIFAAVAYSFVAFLDALVLLTYFILNPIAKRKRRLEQTAQTTLTPDVAKVANASEATLVSFNLPGTKELEKGQATSEV